MGHGRTKTAAQIAAAFAGLLKGIGDQLNRETEFSIRRGEQDWERNFRERQLAETKREHDLLNEDRDAAREARAQAARDKAETQNDWMSQMLHRGKASVDAASREKYGDFLSQMKEMVDKGMSDEEIAKQLDISPTEGTVPATGAVASLLKSAHIDKPVENGRIKLTMSDYEAAQRKIGMLDPSLQKQFHTEGKSLQSPMMRSEVSPASLREFLSNYRGWRDKSAAAASQPASRPAGKIPSAQPAGMPPQSQPVDRSQALLNQQQRDTNDLLYGDEISRGAAAVRIRQSWFPMLPPTPDEMARMAAQAQGPQEQGVGAHPADQFTMQGAQSRPASRPAKTQQAFSGYQSPGRERAIR